MLNTVIPIFSTGAGAAVGDFESIATVTVGSGGSSTIDFTSIPSTYAHLQIRCITRNTSTSDTFRLRFNSDSGNNYTRHFLYGDGSSALAAAGTSTSSGALGIISTSNDTASIFSGFVIDILDYTNTNKYTTFRSIGGFDGNGSGKIGLFSSVWMNTNAVTSISIFSDSNNQAQYSHFALYGIKSA